MIEQLELQPTTKDLKKDIAYYLRNYCYGKENAIRMKSLARRFNISTRELRKIKRKIVMEDDIPVGSTTRGYYFPKDDNEIMEIAAYYESLSIETRIIWKKYLSMVEKKDWRNML